MTEQTAERWIVTSALVVAGVYGYRRLTEQPATPPVTVKQLAGVGQLPPLGAWATAWGFTFLVIAIIGTAAPELGAAFAILIATGDLLTNASSIFQDVTKLEGKTAATTPTDTTASAITTPTQPATTSFYPDTPLTASPQH